MRGSLNEKERAGVVLLFEKVAKENGGLYPRQDIVEEFYQGSLEKWLAFSKKARRFLLKEGKAVIGHIEIDLEVSNNPYFQEIFLRNKTFLREGYDIENIAVLKRLAIDPERRGAGLGAYLLKEAIYHSKRNNKVASLVVFSDLSGARGLYERAGGRDIGQFREVNGDIMTIYIFDQG